MSNQRKLVGAENPKMGRDNEEGNKVLKGGGDVKSCESCE